MVSQAWLNRDDLVLQCLLLLLEHRRLSVLLAVPRELRAMP